MYGLYPFVVEKLGDLLSSGVRFGLHVHVDGAMRRLDCHIFDGLSVKVVVLAVIPGGSEWERSLLKVVMSLLSCVESYRGLAAVSVGGNLRLGRALASVAHPAMPLVTRRFDAEWLTDLLRRKFIEESSGLEPFSILEYFRFRLAAVIEDSAFDNMPGLREVGSFCFMLCWLVCFFLVGGGGVEGGGLLCFFMA